jgi:uncharacterized membrane protein (UPF0127 family)
MSAPAMGQAFNRTRQQYLATELRVANSHASRFVGLLGTSAREFPAGKGLWIVPCRGVHTLGMRFPIDVLYLDSLMTVIYAEEHLQPWRFAPVRLRAASVLELPSDTIKGTATELGDTIEIQVDTQRGRR